MIFLDHNATTPLLPEVARRMSDVAEQTPLNPSSAHSAGEAARQVVARARESVAELVNCDPEQLIFTSSGTESNNAALWHGAADGTIVTTAVEHSSILATAEMLEQRWTHIEYVAVDGEGHIAPEAVAEQLDQLLSDGPVGLVSIQWANNETGVIQPVEAITEVCHRRGVPIHIDAAQAAGKLTIDLRQTPADFLSVTAHKFHGPTGVGALFARGGVRPWLFGGDQEQGRRAGTENILGIAGMGEATEVRRTRMRTVPNFLTALRDDFESQICARYPWAKINGSGCQRVVNTSNVHFPGLDGQAILAQLDVAGICVTQSSACTNQRPTPSHVLQAMGLSEADAYASVRFSFGETNTHSELDAALSQLFAVIDRLSALERLA